MPKHKTSRYWDWYQEIQAMQVNDVLRLTYDSVGKFRRAWQKHYTYAELRAAGKRYKLVGGVKLIFVIRTA